jgi:hypothetical protein
MADPGGGSAHGVVECQSAIDARRHDQKPRMGYFPAKKLALAGLSARANHIAGPWWPIA